MIWKISSEQVMPVGVPLQLALKALLLIAVGKPTAPEPWPVSALPQSVNKNPSSRNDVCGSLGLANCIHS